MSYGIGDCSRKLDSLELLTGQDFRARARNYAFLECGKASQSERMKEKKKEERNGGKGWERKKEKGEKLRERNRKQESERPKEGMKKVGSLSDYFENTYREAGKQR